MSKGFVIFAQNNGTTDYVRQANILKQSIEKNCQNSKWPKFIKKVNYYNDSETQWADITYGYAGLIQNR